jgi:flagellar motor switch protein FliN/FliY
MADPLRPEDFEQVLKQTPADASARPSAVSEDEIEALLKQAGPAPMAAAAHEIPRPPEDPQSFQRGGAKAVSSETSEGLASPDVELLLRQAEQALASIDQPATSTPPGVKSFQLEEFSGSAASQEVATLELLRDVELDLKIELGRTHMYLEDVLKLRKGSVVPLDKLAGDPVDIYVNGRLIARGEVLVLNDNFCVRVAELVAGDAVAPVD